MTHDRNYYRMLTDSELVRVAMDSTNDLALVLAERLSTLLDIEEQLEAMTNARDESEIQCDVWREEALALQAQLDALKGENA